MRRANALICDFDWLWGLASERANDGGFFSHFCLHESSEGF